MRKKLFILLSAFLIFCIGIHGCGGAKDAFEQGMKDAMNDTSKTDEVSEEEPQEVKTDEEQKQEVESQEPEATEEPDSEATDQSENDDSDNENLESGSYTLPCGMELSYTDHVRNDVTENWRISLTASNDSVSDYAMEYYETMFSNDEEIHGIVNFTLKTTTCIKSMSGCLFVDTYEYVDGEEHDAKILFSGEPLTSKVFNLETGEEMGE